MEIDRYKSARRALVVIEATSRQEVVRRVSTLRQQGWESVGEIAVYSGGDLLPEVPRRHVQIMEREEPTNQPSLDLETNKPEPSRLALAAAYILSDIASSTNYCPPAHQAFPDTKMEPGVLLAVPALDSPATVFYSV